MPCAWFKLQSARTHAAQARGALRLSHMAQLAFVAQTGVDEMREAYRRRLETMMRDLTDLSRAVAIMQVGTPVVVAVVVSVEV